MSYWARIASRRPLPKPHKPLAPVGEARSSVTGSNLARNDDGRCYFAAGEVSCCPHCGYHQCACRPFACDDCNRTFRTTAAKFMAHDCAGKLDSCATLDALGGINSVARGQPGVAAVLDNTTTLFGVDSPHPPIARSFKERYGQALDDMKEIQRLTAAAPYNFPVMTAYSHGQTNDVSGTAFSLKDAADTSKTPKCNNVGAVDYTLPFKLDFIPMQPSSFSAEINRCVEEMARVADRNAALGFKTEWVPGEKENTLVAKTSPIAAPVSGSVAALQHWERVGFMDICGKHLGNQAACDCNNAFFLDLSAKLGKPLEVNIPVEWSIPSAPYRSYLPVSIITKDK